MATIYESTQALTIVQDLTGKHVYVYRDQAVDAATCNPDDLKRLVAEGFLVKKADAAQDTGSASGNIKDIVAEVGDDVEKAKAALAAETGEGGESRPTLVKKLEAIIAAGGSGS